jgi:hypothetical protein
MSSIFGGGIGFLLVLPVLIAQWIGVIALGKSGRHPAWWCMMVGTVLTTISAVLSVLAMVIVVTGTGGYGFGVSFLIVSGLWGLGSLVFAVGFAMHGLRSNRVMHRVEELESLIAAQGEQLNRQNPGESS